MSAEYHQFKDAPDNFEMSITTFILASITVIVGLFVLFILIFQDVINEDKPDDIVFHQVDGRLNEGVSYSINLALKISDKTDWTPCIREGIRKEMSQYTFVDMWKFTQYDTITGKKTTTFDDIIEKIVKDCGLEPMTFYGNDIMLVIPNEKYNASELPELMK